MITDPSKDLAIQTDSCVPSHQASPPFAGARDVDPNVLQRRASNPNSSVWVSASAGSGKTKVLTDRVLRLLLPRGKNEPGSPIHKILCLTFTKAAASEMALRISSILSKWAVASDEKLSADLQSLLGRTAKNFELSAARRLFAEVVDRPYGGLQIMTIHAFCQSLLGRFPLESGVAPSFEVMEEAETKALLSKARHKFFTNRNNRAQVQKTLSHLAKHLSDNQLEQLLGDISKEREQFTKILNHFGSLDALSAALCNTYQIDENLHIDEVVRSAIHIPHLEPDLHKAGQALAEHGGKTDQEKGQKILNWLAMDEESRITELDLYKRAFLKADGEPYAKIAGKPVLKALPEAEDILSREQLRLLSLENTLKKLTCLHLTLDLFFIAQGTLEAYTKLKAEQNLLDFDDLIEKTCHLLGNDENSDIAAMRSWVLFKLDQGLDHILVDEAQDTNPEQWKILKNLCEEFYSGSGARDETNRSLFVVGDEKQSIYSFQRASPEEFQSMRSYFERRIEQAQQSWDPVNLNISFRTTKSVLGLVDAVFNHINLPNDPGFDNTRHIPFRRGQAGLAELWPTFTSEDIPVSTPWEPPLEIEDSASGSQKCAAYIAEKIALWLRSGEVLESKSRPIHPGDIMILVRSRSAFVSQLIRALKQKDIPVSGEDRMILASQLVVKDLCALAEFALYPDDDLTLATLLKSPLIGMTEEDLYQLAVERRGSLWEELLRSSLHNPIKEYLKNIRREMLLQRPYEFFTSALHHPCPANKNSGLRAIDARLGNDARDPLEEFLSLALHFEAKHTPSLQNFLQHFKTGSTQIKRQLEDVQNAVRIMTIHGSKGLQAPIVILPDTIRSKRYIPTQIDKRLLWPQKTNLDVPLFSPRSELDFDLYKNAFNELEDRNDEEYRRLLYVAMTRAEDRLYVTGYNSKAKPIPQSWYNYVEQAFETLEDIQIDNDNILENFGVQTQIKRLYNPQLVEVTQRVIQPVHTDRKTSQIPLWALSNAPSEPSPPRPLMPSRPSELEQSILSPLENKSNRFRRGNLTHKLLQVLPDMPPEKREITAKSYLATYATDLQAHIQQDIIKEIMAILSASDYADLFGPQSLAEVPLTGLIGAEIISGQIDRILITDEVIKIVDYKTNRPPPTDPKDVPQIYMKQMRAYYNTLRVIYPNTPIKCALLWTDGPKLMPLDI